MRASGFSIGRHSIVRWKAVSRVRATNVPPVGHVEARNLVEQIDWSASEAGGIVPWRFAASRLCTANHDHDCRTGSRVNALRMLGDLLSPHRFRVMAALGLAVIAC